MTRVLTMTAFHSRQLLRTSFFLHESLLAPVAFMTLLAMGRRASGVDVGTDLWVTATTAGLWSTTTLAVGIIGFQRHQGTLEHLVLTCRPPGVVFGALTSAAAAIGLAGLPGCLALQWALTRQVSTSWQAVTSIAASGVACAASAAVLSSFFVLVRSATVFEPLVLLPVWLLSGLTVPVDALPTGLALAARLHPLTSAVAIAHTTEAATSLSLLGASVVTSGIWGVLAAALSARAHRAALVHGTLGLS